jgi:branched-chain amino acid aminotransferase
MTLHPLSGAPSNGWKLKMASLRLPAGEKLAQFKTANKLAQVLARAEAEVTGADEAVLLNTDGFVVEGASSNLFWVEGETVCTPPLVSGILAGVTRAVTVELCQHLKLPFAEREITEEELRRASGVFVTLSSLGVVECDALDGVTLQHSPLVEKLSQAYDELLSRG